MSKLNLNTVTGLVASLNWICVQMRDGETDELWEQLRQTANALNLILKEKADAEAN